MTGRLSDWLDQDSIQSFPDEDASLEGLLAATDALIQANSVATALSPTLSHVDSDTMGVSLDRVMIEHTLARCLERHRHAQAVQTDLDSDAAHRAPLKQMSESCIRNKNCHGDGLESPFHSSLGRSGWAADRLHSFNANISALPPGTLSPTNSSPRSVTRRISHSILDQLPENPVVVSKRSTTHSQMLLSSSLPTSPNFRCNTVVENAELQGLKPLPMEQDSHCNEFMTLSLSQRKAQPAMISPPKSEDISGGSSQDYSSTILDHRLSMDMQTCHTGIGASGTSNTWPRNPTRSLRPWSSFNTSRTSYAAGRRLSPSSTMSSVAFVKALESRLSEDYCAFPEPSTNPSVPKSRHRLTSRLSGRMPYECEPHKSSADISGASSSTALHCGGTSGVESMSVSPPCHDAPMHRLMV